MPPPDLKLDQLLRTEIKQTRLLRSVTATKTGSSNLTTTVSTTASPNC